MAERLKGSGRVFVVAVAGDSGSGKTTLSRGIRRLLGEEAVSTFSTETNTASTGRSGGSGG